MRTIKATKNAIVLSSYVSIYKTEQFIKQTQGIVDLDSFLHLCYSAIVLSLHELNLKNNHSYILQTLEGNNKFFIKTANSLDRDNVNSQELIFYKYIGQGKVARKGDRRLLRYISAHGSEDVLFNFYEIEDNETDNLNKLYVLANSDSVNFPLLNANQNKIVKMEDNNILVQGVAGSGKTNICIDKIVYSACRHYSGRCLYSTYSHALLEDTKKRVNIFLYNVDRFIEKHNNNEIVYIDSNHKKAAENYLGINIEGANNDNFIEELKQISQYLSTKVDYFLIEDLYSKHIKKDFSVADESTFKNEYLKNIKNYNLLANIDKIKYLSNEIIYKEIYGAIFGFSQNGREEILTKDQYIDLRQNSFTRQEADIIYSLAIDYLKFMKANSYIDNNFMSRDLLKVASNIKYSLVVLDEVQDFTQINLLLFKKITLKMLCVGDVLQMINPSYFSLSYLKNLMFEEGLVNVVELKNNYRNSRKIEEIVNCLSQINIEKFGLHSFVLKGTSVDVSNDTNALYVNDGNMLSFLKEGNFSNLTIVVANSFKKEQLRLLLPKVEILTVSEIKGLERNTILLVDILSDNYEKWDYLQRSVFNRKKAEENSVYRYYFNLLYVGITRAKLNLIVNERKEVSLFDSFFNQNFKKFKPKNAVELLSDILEKDNLNEDDIYERAIEFIKLEQYDNARWTAKKITNEEEQFALLRKIDIYEKYVRNRLYREAGIEFWKNGMFEEAKEQFKLSNDEKLIELLDACANGNGQKLEYDIVKFYVDIMDNDVAKNLILDTLKNDLSSLKEEQNIINMKINKRKNK